MTRTLLLCFTLALSSPVMAQSPTPSPNELSEARPSPGPSPNVKTIYNRKCLTRALGGFCLGAAAEGNLPGTAKRTPHATGEVWSWQGAGGHPESALVVDGKVVTLTRKHTPATWAGYRELLAPLEESYGPGQDRGSFPPAATDDTARAQAITQGQGHAQRVWSQPGYWFAVTWTGPGHIVLGYSMSEPQTSMGTWK